ncbi:MAG TPA: IclR family transcriptional regulator [Devosia sp.]|nr:IclR family transcriptional regulator [Devosia sp.]
MTVRLTLASDAIPGFAAPPAGPRLADAELGAIALADALAVLDLFSAARRSLSPADIEQATGWDDYKRNGVINTLLDAGLIAPQAEGGAYTVGIRALELAYAYEHSNPLVEICTPLMREVRDKVNETVMLAVRWGDYRVNIAQMTSQHPVHQNVPEGERRALYVGCGGKILLAAMTDAEIEQYLDRVPLKRMSPTTTTDRYRLLHAIQAIRATGYSETFSDGNEGGAGIGVGIRNGAGRIVAALVVSIPLYRYRHHLRDQVIQALMRACDEATERLGGRASFG